MTRRDETSVSDPPAGKWSAHLTTEPRVFLRLRVSRDSGRTWGVTTEVREDEKLRLLDNPGALPPCACPRCSSPVRRPEAPYRKDA